MKSYLLFLIAPAFVACAGNTIMPSILEKGFGNNFDSRAGVIFLEGPWHTPRSGFGFQILDGKYRESYLSEDGKIKTFEVAASQCNSLNSAIDDLMKAVSKSANIVDGLEKTEEPQVLVTDGYDYQLDIYSRLALGNLSLRGGSTTADVLPWISASLKVSDIAEKCTNN